MALTYIYRKLPQAHFKPLATDIVWKGLYQIGSRRNVKNYCPKLDFKENYYELVIWPREMVHVHCKPFPNKHERN